MDHDNDTNCQKSELTTTQAPAYDHGSPSSSPFALKTSRGRLSIRPSCQRLPVSLDGSPRRLDSLTARSEVAPACLLDSPRRQPTASETCCVHLTCALNGAFHYMGATYIGTRIELPSIRGSMASRGHPSADRGALSHGWLRTTVSLAAVTSITSTCAPRTSFVTSSRAVSW